MYTVEFFMSKRCFDFLLFAAGAVWREVLSESFFASYQQKRIALNYC